MDAERWQRLQDLFEKVRELDDDERRDYLERACGDDEELREKVESLVRHDLTGGRTMEGFVAAAAEGIAAPDRRGRRIGPYRIERELGAGGMGTVWLAVRDDGVHDARVAIKTVRGIPGKELLARFTEERRILASLEHPNIARLLDGGTTDDGVPYVVMEYVDGLPLDRYCDEHRLDTAARLRLFRSVCSAVQYAHLRLVVHRDIKPGNILVTSDGVPKLLDFGIAKLLDPKAASGERPETAASIRLLTPEYASPEQVRGEPITTATDVYSLGVLLYELLSGNRPYRIESRSAPELARQICEQDPERPSTAVTHDPPHGRATDPRHTTADAVAGARSVPAPRLRKQLAGDLDNIVLCAMRKEPDRRYASPQLLSDDIGRHLDGLPVTARPSTWRYRSGKFLRRHRWGATAAAAVAVLVIGLVGFYTLRLRDARARAEAEARSSRRVSEFLVETFKSADPYEYRGEPVSAKEILDRGAARIDSELSDDPAIRLRLMETMSRAYRNLNEFEPAVRLIDSAIELEQRTAGVSAETRADLLGLRGSILTSLSRLDEARVVLEQAFQASVEARGRVHEDSVMLNNSLGIVDEFAGKWDEAEARYVESLELAAQLPDAPDTAAAADTQTLLARLYSRNGMHDKSIEYAAECVRIQDRILAENDPGRQACINLLGTCYSMKGDFEAAEPVLLESARLARTLLGETALATANAVSNLSGLYKRHGDPQRALPLIEESVRIHRLRLPADHPELAVALNNLANVLQDLGRVEESLAPQREALAINRKAYGDEHPAVASNLNNLAAKLRDLRHFQEAEEAYRATLEIDEKTLDPNHPFLAMDWCNLAVLYIDMKRYDEAEPLLRRALELQDGNPDVNPVNLTSTLVTLADLLLRTGRTDQAEPLAVRAVEIREETLKADSQELAWAHHVLGAVLLARGEIERARRLMEPAFEVLRTRAATDPSLRTAAARMADLSAATKDR